MWPAPPVDTAALFAEAARLHQAGRLPEADQAYRRVLAIAPRHAEALHMLGVLAGQVERHDVSLRLIDEALAASPNFAEAHSNRGVALAALGRTDEAVAAFRKAVSLKRDHVEAHYSLANILREAGRMDEAIQAYHRTLVLSPRFAEAHNNLGIALQKQGRLEEAEGAYRRALALKPHAQIPYNLSHVLLQQGRLEEAQAACEQALALNPDYPQAHSNLLLIMGFREGVSAEALLAAHRDWDRRHAQRPAPPPYANSRDPERRLRIGYVSGDFQRHPVSYFLTRVLAAHDPEAVEVFCYSNSDFEDEVTAQLRGHAHHWRPIAGLSDEAAEALVRRDAIDILIDLSGHTDKNRLALFARCPAPVQASWLGYPGTTGLAAIDYLIMDADTAPEGAERFCSETVIRLPHGRFCYAPPDYAPDIAARRPGQPITFGSFNAVAKLGPEVVRLWARVLEANPGSRLILKWKALGERAVRQRLRSEFTAAGIDKKRLDLRASSPHPQMLAEYGEVDVALDPFPFSGGLTSAEALWMGVPVVTLPGDRPASRQTLAFLNQIGLGDLAASSEDDYVRIATALAADAPRRADLRKTLRGRMTASPLCDGARFTPDLEAAFRRMWRARCV